MKVNVLLAAAITCAMATPTHAHGTPDFFQSDWSDAVAVTEVNSSVADGCPIETSDGLSLLFASMRAGGLGGNDIIWANRKALAPTRDPRERYVRIVDLICKSGRFNKSGLPAA